MNSKEQTYQQRPPDRQVRYAVVGLGYISQIAVLPAFAHAGENSELTALVSGDAEKLRKLGKKYGVSSERCYLYEAYDELLAGGQIDAVYIALPNNMHCDYAVRAAQAGVHVLCEKPMAVTAEECLRMIETAQDNDVRLMIAYRLHFEQANLEAIEIAQSGRLGDLRFFSSVFSMQVCEGNSRLQRDLGGGTLYDIGIYCINAARYLFRDEPVEVFAVTADSGDARFREVDESTSAVLTFPGGRLAGFTSSFGSADTAHYRIVGTKGDLCVEAAYELAEPMRHRLTIQGRTKEKRFAKRDQFAPELLHFSACVLNGEPPGPSGEEGLADVRIIQALYESAQKGRGIEMSPIEPPTRPAFDQEILCPAVRKPRLINAHRPTEEAAETSERFGTSEALMSTRM